MLYNHTLFKVIRGKFCSGYEVKTLSSFYCPQRKVVILVQTDEKIGVKEAMIKVNSSEEATRTNDEGRMTLSKAFKIGTTLSIEIVKSGYEIKDKSIEVKDNNGQDNLVTMSGKQN